MPRKFHYQCKTLDIFNLFDFFLGSVKPSDFEFLKVIGKGSFGRVLLARNKNEGNIYAIKVLQKQAIMKRNEVKHIMSERNVLLKNVKHPFLVGLHYSFQTADKLYFVLDYVNGGEVSILQFTLIDLCQLLCYCMNTCVLLSYFLLGKYSLDAIHQSSYI